jgi:hypothetical protein
MTYQEYWLFLTENLKALSELKTNDCVNAKNCAITNTLQSCLYLAKFDTLLKDKLKELELEAKQLEEKEKELAERAKNLDLLKQQLDKILTIKN